MAKSDEIPRALRAATVSSLSPRFSTCMNVCMAYGSAQQQMQVIPDLSYHQCLINLLSGSDFDNLVILKLILLVIIHQRSKRFRQLSLDSEGGVRLIGKLGGAVYQSACVNV
jgi:hypothetical protein